MKKVINFFRNLQRNNVFYFLFGGQVLCILVYYFSSIGLEKPAGFIEAAKFFFLMIQQYFISISVGAIAWIIATMLLISVFLELPFIKEIFEDDNYSYRYSYYRDYEQFENLSRNKYIINWVIVVIAFVLNILFLKFLAMLLLVLIAIIAAVIVLTWMLSQ